MTFPTPVSKANWARKKGIEELLLGVNGYKPSAGVWSFEEPAGTILFDRLRGNHGTYNSSGVTLATTSICAGESLTAVAFDGVNGFATVPDANSLDVADTFTVGGAIKLGATGVKQYIVDRGTAAFAVYVDTDNKLKVEKSGTGLICLSTSTLDTSAHAWEVKKTGATVQITIDGIDVTGTITNQTCTATATSLYIGESNAGANRLTGTLQFLYLDGTYWTPLQTVTTAVAILQGELGGPFDSFATRFTTLRIRRGRSRDRQGETVGTLTGTFRNGIPANGIDHYFTDQRNLAPNASFGCGIHDTTASLTGFLTAGSALRWIADAPTGAGSYALRVTTTSADHGAGWLIPGLFESGSSVSYAISAKAESGTPTVQYGIGSTGTPADVQTGTATLSTSWQDLATITWTPSGNRTDVGGFIRDHAGAAISMRVSKVRVNRGSSINTWIDAPTWPMLQPGVPLIFYGTSSGTDYGRFAGTIDSINETPLQVTAEVTALDAFGTVKTNIDLAINYGTHYTARYGIIDAAIRAMTGAYRNLCINGNFESGSTVGWTLGSGAAASNSAASLGSYSLKVPGNSGAIYGPAVPASTYQSGRYFVAAWKARLVGSSDSLVATFGEAYATGDQATSTSGTGSPPALTSSFQQYSLVWQPTADRLSSAVFLQFSCTSKDSTRGAYIDEVGIYEGITAQTFVEWDSPSGRLQNFAAAWQSVEAAPIFQQGWSNRVSNPEAVTNTSGWTSRLCPYFVGANPGQAALNNNPAIVADSIEVSGWSDSDTQTYTISVAAQNNVLYCLWVENSHATSANTVTAPNTSGLTFVSVATRQFSGTTRRLTLLRALKTSGATTGQITITVAGTANTGCGWVLRAYANVDTTGTNGSGAVAQSAASDSSTAVSTYTATGLAAASNALNLVACGMAWDGGGALVPGVVTNTTSSNPGGFANPTGTWRGGSAPAGAMMAMESAVAGVAPAMSKISGTAIACAIAVEITGTTGGTLTRVTAGGYAGGYSTAFNLASAAGVGVYCPITGTERSGHTYTLMLDADTLAASTPWIVGVMSLTGGDVVYQSLLGPFAHGAGQHVTMTLTLTADRTDAVIFIRAAQQNYATLPGALTWSGVMFAPGTPSTYARNGATSPSTLDECASITTVADGVSHSHCTQFTTYATAGSGIILPTTVYAVNGRTYTGLVAMKASTGTPSMAIGLVQPWGAVSADQASKTWTISTSWRRYWVQWTAAANQFAVGSTVNLYVMVTTATAVTVSVDDISVTLGTAVQPFIPRECGLIDTADTDIAHGVSLVAADAFGALSAMGVSMTRMAIDPFTTRPFWKLRTVARQSVAGQSSQETYAVGDLNDIPSLQRARGTTFQRVIVTHRDPSIVPGTGVSTPCKTVVSAVAAQTAIDSIGQADTLTVDGSVWLNGPVGSDTTCQDIANLQLSRYQVARPLPRFAVTKQRFPSILQRKPGERVVVNSTKAQIATQSYSILAVEEAVDPMNWTATYEAEEWRPS